MDSNQNTEDIDERSNQKQITISPENMDLLELNNRLSRIGGRFLHELRHDLDQYGISFNQYNIFHVVKKLSSPTTSEIGHHCHIRKGNLTPIIDRLENDGYLLRVNDPQDRRVVRISLTEKGNKFHDEVCSLVEIKILDRFYNSLSSDQLSQLKHIISCIEKNMES